MNETRWLLVIEELPLASELRILRGILNAAGKNGI